MNQSSEQTNNELKDKPVLSPPTPMLLLPSQATNIEDDNNNKTIEPNVTKLALIEAHDSAEMNLILSTIRQIFPGVNVHMCNDDKNLKLQQDSKTYLTVSRPNCSSPEYNKTNSRNSLNTKKTSDRASSIDNSSLSNDTSIERQESKDSGFWTRTKCSFESMKSLSISDHSNKNTNEIPVNQNTNNEENSSTTNTLSTSISTAFNNENDTSKNYLTSPRSSIGYNWKKWKKGQAWRYNSSSNTNLSDNSTQNGSLNNDTSHIRTNNASFNSDNSSFSIERTEDESNESYSNNTNSTSYFSNSFELATSKLSLLHQVSLQPWSSTSKLEVINSSGIDSSQILSQKRRGKLVRDRTIDTPDEATTTNSFSFQQKETNVKFASSTNLNEETDRWSSSPLSCSTPSQMFKEKEKLNGRVSPPEKRVSLCFKGDSENDKVENILKNEEIQNAIYTALSSNSKLDPNDLKQIISNILSSKTLFSEDLIKQITEMNNEVNQRVTSSSPTSSCPSPSSSITPVSPLSSGLIPTVKKLSLLSPKSISPSQITTPHQVQYDFHKDLQSKLNLKSNSESEDTQDVSDHLVKNSYSFAPFKSMQQENDNQKSDPTACLNPNCNKNPNLKNINSSSFDYKFINNNYLANNLAQSNNNKPIYRSNSSPSYSSSQLPDPAAQFTSPLFTKNNDSNNDLINFNEQTKINCFQQQLQQQPYFPFNFNFNKSLPQSTTNLNYNQFDQHFHLQHQQHLLQKNTYYPINGLEANISMASKHLNNNRLIKPPAIVITESKIDYEENDNKNFLSNQIDSSERNIGKNETFEAMIRSNEFNRNKFMNNSFGFNQSFESAIKKLPENMLKNNDNYWKANSLNLNQAKDIKSMQSTAATAASKALKSHICTSCQKRFARSDMLIRHSRLHSGVRPYRCNRCGQEFSRSDHLNTHLRTHTGEKPYTCPHPKCSYAACRKDMITRHLKVHSKNNLSRLSLSFDSAKLSENNLRSKLLFESPFSNPTDNTNSIISTANNIAISPFSILNRMETHCFENKSSNLNSDNCNNNNKSSSSLTSF